MILNEALDHKNVLDSIPLLIYANTSLISTFLCEYIQSWHGSTDPDLVQPSSLLHFLFFEKKKSRKKLDFQSRGYCIFYRDGEFQLRSFGFFLGQLRIFQLSAARSAANFFCYQVIMRSNAFGIKIYAFICCLLVYNC